MQRCAPVFVNAIDAGAIHEQCLNKFNLAWELVENCIVKGRSPCVIGHVHKISRITAQDGEDLLSRVLGSRTASEVHRMSTLEITLERIRLVFYEKAHKDGVALEACNVQRRL